MANWLLHAYRAVSVGIGRRKAKVDAGVQIVLDTHEHEFHQLTACAECAECAA